MQSSDDTTLTLASDRNSMTYHTVEIEGINLFYRQAGQPGRPVVLLLHGFPSSSRMYETLMPLLADRYHLIAPDYPGFGLSDAPPADDFAVQDQVTHDKYGLGRVIGVEDDTAALFIDFGSRQERIMTPCAKLTRL